MADVAAVAFGCDVFSHLFDGFTRNNLCADGGLYGNVKLLAG